VIRVLIPLGSGPFAHISIPTGTSVVDPKFFFSDPYPDTNPTFQEISDPDPAPDPDPTQLLSKEVNAKFL